MRGHRAQTAGSDGTGARGPQLRQFLDGVAELQLQLRELGLKVGNLVERDQSQNEGHDRDQE